MCGAYTGEHEIEMFQAEIELEYDDGSKGAKVIYAHSQEQVMDDACEFVGSIVAASKMIGDKRVIKHRVIGGKRGVQF